MARYLLIESKDPYESREVEHDYELASSLAKAGNEVTLLLIQNGVFPARGGAQLSGLQKVIASGVEVLGDEFSLRERGISDHDLNQGIQSAPLDIVVDQMAQGSKTMWL